MFASGKMLGFVPIVDVARARHFYVDILQGEVVSDDPFALQVRIAGSDIRLTKLKEHTPADFTILGWEVPAIAEAVGELSNAGVAFQRFSFMEQDALGIWTAPGGTRVAWFKDPDGNVLSLSQPGN